MMTKETKQETTGIEKINAIKYNTAKTPSVHSLINCTNSKTYKEILCFIRQPPYTSSFFGCSAAKISASSIGVLVGAAEHGGFITNVSVYATSLIVYIAFLQF